jgi:hypothetical protein
MELELYGQIFEKYSNTRFHENLSSGNRVVTCGRTDRLGKANVALSNFANAPQNVNKIPQHDAVNYRLSDVISCD